MPYIKPKLRKDLDSTIDDLVDILHYNRTDGLEGQVNYVFTRILHSLFDNKNYKDYNAAVGILECCKLEFYRRKVKEYEEQKIIDNGDIE